MTERSEKQVRWAYKVRLIAPHCAVLLRWRDRRGERRGWGRGKAPHGSQTSRACVWLVPRPSYREAEGGGKRRFTELLLNPLLPSSLDERTLNDTTCTEAQRH